MKTNWLKTAFFAITATLLAACGGGGGTGGAGSSGSGSSPTGPATLALSMTNPGTGATTRELTYGSSGVMTATVTRGNSPIEGALVTFSVPDVTIKVVKCFSDGICNTENSTVPLVKITPAIGTALTDAKGIATIRVEPANLLYAGAVTLTAKTDYTNGTASATATSDYNITVGAATLTLSNIAASLQGGATSLSPYATTSISVNVGGVPTTTSVPIAFTSTCAATGKASITATVNSSNGVAVATYQDKGCAGVDTITASPVGTTTTAALNLKVDAPSAAAIQFVSATPSTLIIRSTGSSSVPESSIVIFKLVDNNNQPIANRDVVLDLTTRSGGILLDGTSAGTITRQTDSAGLVRVSVSSGTTPTAVWVTATHTTPSGSTFRTQSNQLQISTGVPSQDRFSLSVETFNIEGLHINGKTTNVSVIASDRVGNPVPNGTAINFISSGGQIGTTTAGTCTTVNGACSIVFTSASPRPNNGRVAISAYAIGEETFVDANSNNVFDAGEAFQDLGEVYVDSNLNGIWDSGEQAISFGANAAACTNNVVTAEQPQSRANTCNGAWGAAHVRKNSLVIFSGRQIEITSTTGSSPGATCQAVFATFNAYDENNNPLPFGTTLSVANLPASGWKAEITPPTVGNSAAIGGTRHAIKLTPDGDCLKVTGFNARITAVTPSGATSTSNGSIQVPSALIPPPGTPRITSILPGTAAGTITVTYAGSSTDITPTTYVLSCTDNAPTPVTPVPLTTTGAPGSVSATVSGLTSGRSATCKVTASNLGGGPISSAVSSAVTVP